MLDIILQVLSVAGIIFLILLGLLAAVVLLVLFFPISYRICGSKNGTGIRLSVRVRWLFGLVRAQYGYPEPKYAVVKALWFTLYRTKIPADKGEDTPSGMREEEDEEGQSGILKKKRRSGLKGQSRKKKVRRRIPKTGAAAEESVRAESVGLDAVQEETVRTQSVVSLKDDLTEGNGFSEESTSESGQVSREDIPPGFPEKISQKITKIKYTIYNIYDKIKKIWKNISYYIGLLREEETKRIFGHVLLRLGKILKNIRPRRIKAEVLFGTGSPDTTGYIYGVYCVITSGSGSGVQVVPDFEHAILCGEVDLSGHVMAGVLLMNVLRLLLDKRLRRLLKKMKV